MKAIAYVITAVLLGLALAGCGGDDEASTSTTTETTETQQTETTQTTTDEVPLGATVVRVVVVNGVPSGGIVRETVAKGDRVALVVTSDVADEVHVHGYDVSRDIAAGGTVQIRFKATLPGRFEVELEERGVPIAELTVSP